MKQVAIERELRRRLTAAEYRLLQARLTGAVKAIATLCDCAPDLLPHMFDGFERAKALPPRTQGALVALIDELLFAAGDVPADRADRQRLLKIVKHAGVHAQRGRSSGEDLCLSGLSR